MKRRGKNEERIQGVAPGGRHSRTENPGAGSDRYDRNIGRNGRRELAHGSQRIGACGDPVAADQRGRATGARGVKHDCRCSSASASLTIRPTN